MSATAMVHVRVDPDTKAQATATLAAMGLSVSDAVRLLLRRIAVEKALPFEVRVPNADTREAMLEADEIVRVRAARFASADALLNDLEEAHVQ